MGFWVYGMYYYGLGGIGPGAWCTDLPFVRFFCSTFLFCLIFPREHVVSGSDGSFFFALFQILLCCLTRYDNPLRSVLFCLLLFLRFRQVSTSGEVFIRN